MVLSIKGMRAKGVIMTTAAAPPPPPICSSGPTWVAETVNNFPHTSIATNGLGLWVIAGSAASSKIGAIWSTDGFQSYTAASGMPVYSGAIKDLVCVSGRFMGPIDFVTFAYSDDGNNWTTVGTPGGAAAFASLANGRCFVVDDSTNTGYWTTNGTTFTPFTMPGTDVYTSIAYVNGNYIAFGYQRAYYSTNLITWNNSTVPAPWLGGGGAVSQWAYSPSSNTIVGVDQYSPGGAYKSIDNGVTWTAITMPVTGSTLWRDVIYSQGAFLACQSSTHSLAISTNQGVTWSIAANTFTPAATGFQRMETNGTGLYVAMSNGGSSPLTLANRGTC